MNRVIRYVKSVDWITLFLQAIVGVLIFGLTYMLLVLAFRFFTNFGGI